jgi:hypothetical protein
MLQAPPLVEVEGAGGINFYFWIFAQDGTQLALKTERALPHLRHGESYNPIRHKLRLSGCRAAIFNPA